MRADDLELAELVGRGEADGALLEVVALVDVTADGAQVVGLVGGGVDVVVGVHVQLGVHGLGELGAGEHELGLLVALLLSDLDEARVHVGGLVDLAQGAGDEVQVGSDALGLGSGGALVARLDLGDHAGLKADVDLLGGAGGLEQAGDLVETLLLGGSGAGGVLGGRAGLATHGGLQVLEGGAHLGDGLGDHVEVAGVLSSGDNVTQIH